jgi:hypothetical protein
MFQVLQKDAEFKEMWRMREELEAMERAEEEKVRIKEHFAQRSLNVA